MDSMDAKVVHRKLRWSKKKHKMVQIADWKKAPSSSLPRQLPNKKALKRCCVCRRLTAHRAPLIANDRPAPMCQYCISRISRGGN